MSKFKEHQTRLRKFIVNDLGGEFLRDSDSSHYFKLKPTGLKIRVSDHLNAFPEDLVDIVFMPCQDILVHYKSSVMCIHSLTEVKNMLKTLHLIAYRFENPTISGIMKELNSIKSLILPNTSALDVSKLSKGQKAQVTKWISENSKKQLYV